jgi:hypothetical protein
MSGVKRFGRCILNAATGLFLLFFMASAALWVRSYFTTLCIDQAYSHTNAHSGGQSAILITSRGRTLVYLTPVYFADRAFALTLRPCNGPSDVKNWIASGIGLTSDLNFVGFSLWRSAKRGNEGIVIPCWFVVIVLALGSAVFLRLRLGMSPVQGKEFCISCGYDLRATPDRCPECGTVTSMVNT